MARVIFKRRNPGAAGDGSVKVLIVERVIFKRRNPGAAEDWSVKVLIVARVIFSGIKAPKKVCCGARQPGREPDPGQGPGLAHQYMRAATTRGLPPTAPIPTPQKVSLFRGQKKGMLRRAATRTRAPPKRLPLGDT